MTSTEKQRRMELRRATGTRAIPKPAVRSTSKAGEPLSAHACFDCRTSTKRVSQGTRVVRCPSCGGRSYEMGRSFRAPKKTDREKWSKVRMLFAHGFRFFSYRSCPEAPRLPRWREPAACSTCGQPDRVLLEADLRLPGATSRPAAFLSRSPMNGSIV
jgi:hypothetical protein